MSTDTSRVFVTRAPRPMLARDADSVYWMSRYVERAEHIARVLLINTNLLMEAARRLDEWRVLQKKVPSMELVPEFVIPEGREGQINLNTSEWLILSKIDGRRSIKAIANASSHSTFEACKILYGLIATNLIRLKEPAAAPAPRRASAVGWVNPGR